MAKLFTPQNTALLLIDHQVGTMQLIKNIEADSAKRMALALAKAARILGIPTVLTSSQEDRAQGPLLPELEEILPEAFAARVKRAGIVNAWNDPAFKAAVEATGRKNLIMAGVTTDVCLVFTAIDAVGEGFEVQAVMDASGSPFELSEDMSRRRMENAGVVLTATNTVIAELAQDWSSPEGGQLIQLLFEDVLPPIAS
ncbi:MULTISPECIES: isochorismatase family protein [unclassified Aureimonas]|uniref:isochorismatase family protein n=1 Tax=unclassified Aureimonas TaxID=2615206 RepID=UPI0006F539FA|nr:MULTISPECIES: isochorismatase family protein [unclassified Aureimonas]KQT52319.1 isochorismatase [Aureimonas sp. Leaf427]KQT61795.1 isochorismatase [Aureimonas sp. Leaf460]